MAKQYTFVEITDAMRAACPAELIAQIEQNNKRALLQNMSEEEKAAYKEQLDALKKIDRDNKKVANRKAHYATFSYGEQEEGELLSQLVNTITGLTIYESSKLGSFVVIKGNSIDNNTVHVLKGATKAKNASIQKKAVPTKENKWGYRRTAVLHEDCMNILDQLCTGKNIGQLIDTFKAFVSTTGKNTYAVVDLDSILDTPKGKKAVKLFNAVGYTTK